MGLITLSLAIFLLIRQKPDYFDNAFLVSLSIASFISLILVAVLGYIVSVFVVTRINRMANTANEIIKTGDLSKRLTIDSRWDDLSYLSGVLNEMLDKIETLMEGVQHITDTVAHDLRTPLARLRNKLETSDYNTDNKMALIQEVDGLLKTFNALLSLSSIESGRQSTKFEEFDLEKVVVDAVNFYTPLAQDKEQILQLEAMPISYVGDRDLFFQVIANLLDNAIKFTPNKGNISVAITESQNNRQIIITDSGPGIREDSIEKVFDRFYRDKSESQKEGSGLGLSLVKAVLQLHGAKIKIENVDPGLRVKIYLD